jgi:DNA polymerase-3 subunit epsilon
MQIIKPIVFFDIESTGLDVLNDRIVQIATLKLCLDGTKEEKCYLINPQISIPKEASDIHGITDDIIKEEPYFKQLAKSLCEYFRDCDIGGFNSDYFDIPILIKEFERCGIVFPDWELNTIDVYKYEKHLRPNNLKEVYKRYTGKELEGAHDALNDVRATLEVLLHQVDGNDEIMPSDIDLYCQGDKLRFDFNQKTYMNKEGYVCWSFGKNINKPVINDLEYLKWVLNNDFPEETKSKLKTLLK